MSKNSSESVDDFFVISNTPDSTKDLIDTYSEFEEQLIKLQEKKVKVDEVSKLKFFRELRFQRKNEVLYRKSGDADKSLSVYWLSRVKEVANYFAQLNNIPKFQEISKENLTQIAKLSSNVEVLPELEGILAEKGIIFVTEKSLPGLKIDGAVFMLASGQAVVSLSLRYKRLDYFWFTLMHELSHLCLHKDEMESPIIEDLDSVAETLIELEADKLALNSFIPRNVWRNCPPKYSLSKDTIVAFANKVGVHPVIVAGRLRKELNRYDVFSKWINEIDVREYYQ